MDTLAVFLVMTALVTASGLSGWLLFSRRQAAGRRAARKGRASEAGTRGRDLERALGVEARDFSGVSIDARATEKPCEWARDLHKRIFAPEQVPALPLPQCKDKSECRCRYRYHGERREGERRMPNPLEPSYLAHKGIKDRRHTGNARRKSAPAAPPRST